MQRHPMTDIVNHSRSIALERSVKYYLVCVGECVCVCVGGGGGGVERVEGDA